MYRLTHSRPLFSACDNVDFSVALEDIKRAQGAVGKPVCGERAFRQRKEVVLCK